MNDYDFLTANHEDLRYDWHNNVRFPYTYPNHLLKLAKLFEEMDGYLPPSFLAHFSAGFTARFEIIDAKPKYRDLLMYVLLRYMGKVEGR